MDIQEVPSSHIKIILLLIISLVLIEHLNKSELFNPNDNSFTNGNFNTNHRILNDMDSQSFQKNNEFMINSTGNTKNLYEVISKTIIDNKTSYLLQNKGFETYFRVKHSSIIQFLNFSYEFYASNRISVKITDANNTRWEIPHSNPFPYHKNSSLSPNITTTCCTIQVSEKPFAFQIIRKETNEIIFDFDSKYFVYSDMYIKFSTTLPTPNIYGLGERTFKFKLGPTGTYTIFNFDKPDVKETGDPGNNIYGHHPVYLQKEKKGYFDVILLRNSNAMDIDIDNGKMLTFNIVGGIIDLQFFIGDIFCNCFTLIHKI